jgi:hypothetical protein
MTEPEFGRFIERLDTLSEEELRTLRRELDSRLAAMAHQGVTPETDEVLQNRLYEAGLLSEIKPSIRVSTGTEHQDPIKMQGEPLSETINRERP